MEVIKHKKSCKNTIVIVVLVGIIIGFMYYGNYLRSQIEKVTTEKESIETQMDNTVKDLESVKNKLGALREELDITYKEIKMQSEEIKKYKKKIEDESVKWKQRYEEYPVATEVWIYMKLQGWSDIVCSGIMGNLMAETGGSGTLHLDWDDNGEGGYGLVQWIGNRRNAIKNKYGAYPSVKEQVQFIHDELYGTDGVRRQVTDSQFDAIMNAETPEDCAYAFACYYERCAEQYRDMRRDFARKAYSYFVG